MDEIDLRGLPNIKGSPCREISTNISGKQHIAVCVCTYKRPERLRNLLTHLGAQRTEDQFDYSITVADNDRSESARQVVESHARISDVPVQYCVEPEQNISLARNKAVANSRGDFIGFIDDDELPKEDWLLRLFESATATGADGILGPVIPSFEEEPPSWVLRGRLFDRPTHQTNEILKCENTRTGNALVRRSLFENHNDWFDSAFGSGGEDRDFFRRKIEQGHVFRWCNESPVYEAIAPSRWKRTVLIKRALLRGKMALNGKISRPCSVLKSSVAIAVYTTCLPLLLLAGQHVFMKYLIKDCDHLGKVIAYFGIDLVREKYIGG